MAGTEHTPKTPLGGVKGFNCGNCGGQVSLRAPGQSLTAACTHCGSVTDLSDENLAIIAKYNGKQKRKPLIPLGVRGNFEGRPWEVIGFMVRQAVGYEYFWEEYLMFNPRYGFRWLLNQEGHWSLTEPLVEIPVTRGSAYCKHEGQEYKIYSRGVARVTYVFGEFYWQVKRGEQVKTVDYVASPHMLSLEQDDQGSNWTRSRYLKPSELRAAFDVKLKLPRPRGLAPHQPNPYQQQAKQMFLIGLLATLVLIIGLVMNSNGAANEVVTKVEGMSHKGDSLVVSPAFTIPPPQKNVEVHLSTPNLSNAWAFAQGYLYNKADGKSYSFAITNEYYFGVTDGESWTEGSTRGSVVINDVEPGEYELVYQFDHSDIQTEYRFTIRYDVPIFSNAIGIFLIILIPVILILFRSSSFRKRQWADSDFS